MRKITVLSVALFIIGTSLTFGQSVYIEDDQSAMEGAGVFTFGPDSFESRGGFNYSINGMIDLGLAVAGGKFQDEIGFLGYFAGIKAFLLKQNEVIPISISGQASYGYSEYSSDVLDVNEWDMSSNSFALGLNLYRKYLISEVFSIIPSFGFSVAFSTVKLEDSFGGSLEEDDTIMGIVFSVPLVIAISDKSIFTIPVGLSSVEGDLFFAIGLTSVYVF